MKKRKIFLGFLSILYFFWGFFGLRTMKNGQKLKDFSRESRLKNPEKIIRKI